MALDALAVLDAEGVDRAHVIGASMGGVIAQIIGVLHPERTRSLVLACTACRHHEWRRELLQEWADAVDEGGMAALGDEALEWLVGPAAAQAVRHLAEPARPHRAAVSRPSRSSPRSTRSSTRTDELRLELVTIRVPTLVITGSQDSLTPVGDAEELAELIPHAAPRGARRRRARPDGRGAERVQRRGAALPRRGRRPRRRHRRAPAAESA